MESFYTTIQSDASSVYYSDNTRTNFRNHLAIPISVDSNRYEVALSELTYTYNSPYIRANTTLYTLYGINEPELIRNTYEEVKNISGEGAIEEIPKEVLDYAKENKVHISFAKGLANQIPQSGNKVNLVYSTGVFKATKNITSTEDLISELNVHFNPLSISVREELGEEHEVYIIQHRPHVLMDNKITFSDTLKKHFSIGELDGARYINGTFEINSVISADAFVIREGDELFEIKFIQEEISVKPTSTDTENMIIKASKDIHTIQE